MLICYVVVSYDTVQSFSHANLTGVSVVVEKCSTDFDEDKWKRYALLFKVSFG